MNSLEKLIQLPITEPITVFLLLIFVILLIPRLLKSIRVPGIVGFILAGVLIGPHGFNIIADNSGFELFAAIGLIYLMFLVGLEIDWFDFKKNRPRSIIFGGLTFFVPLGIGLLVCIFLLHLKFLPALLLASMFSTHTLISYPIVSRLGITKNRVINFVVGGTIITDTAALLLLAVITNVKTGSLDTEFWIRIILSLSLFVTIVLWVIPKISQWFFSKLEGEGSSQYLYLLAVLFLSAFLAKAAGIEPMIGAFLAGLALNKLVPRSSLLLNRTIFIGNTLFIPFFLISVGMIVDLSVVFNGFTTIQIAGILVITAIISKYMAAWIMQRLFGFSGTERNLIFGLSSSHAAATIALILVGFRIGLVDINVLNGTVLVIFFSCLISSFFTENAGRKIAMTEVGKKETALVKQNILVPVANPETAGQLLKFALLMKDRNEEEHVYALNVIAGNVDDDAAGKEIQERSSILSKALKTANAGNKSVTPVINVEMSISKGISRAIKELMITKVVLGWNGTITTAQFFFGSIIENLLPRCNQMIFVAKLFPNFDTIRKIDVVIPPNGEFEMGFRSWLHSISNIAGHLSAGLTFFGSPNTLEETRRQMDKLKISNTSDYKIFVDFDDLSLLTSHVHENHLLTIVSSRNQSISYSGYLSSIPRQLSKNFESVNFIIIYPEQFSVPDISSIDHLDGVSVSPIRQNIERISRLGKYFSRRNKRKPDNSDD